MSRKFIVLAAALVLLAMDFTASSAQTRRRGDTSRGRGYNSQMSHRFEIIGYGGYAWTISRRVSIQFPPPPQGVGLVTGDIDIADSPFWGVEAAFNLRPGAQLTLLYQRQDTDLTFKSVPNAVVDVSVPWTVEYWHIGGIGGVPRGNVFPFSGLSIGATHYIKSDGGGDAWRFSLMIRLGAKIYLSKRLGLQLQGRMPWTITNGGVGIGIGGGGAAVTFGGSGIAQIDLNGGLILSF
jgi:hypothetical protein